MTPARTGPSVCAMAWPRAFAVLICGGAALTLAASAAFLVRFRDLDPLELVVVSLVLLPAIALGLLIAVRRPHARIAPVLCLTGAVPLVIGFGDVYGAAVAAHPGVLPVSGVLVGLSSGSWMLLYVPAAFVLLLFPDGRLPGPRWRVVAIGLLVVPVAFATLGMFDPDGFDAPYQGVPPPFGPAPDWLVPVAYALLPMFMALLVAAAAAMIVRYRRAADPVLRAQLRWFALAAAFLPLTLLLCWTSYLLLGDADLVVFGLALTLLALPTATTIALLRHDLYDVDRAVSAAATYGLVSAGLLAVFTTVTVVAGALLGRDSAFVAAAATGVSAVALAPLRTRLQRRVDARLYPLRQAVRAELARLRTRIDDGRARPEDLEDTLRRALRDPDLRVGYVFPGRPGLVDLASAPLPVGDGRRVPVRVGDTPVGALLPERTEASRELLREVASDVGLIVEVIRSRLELTEALREVADKPRPDPARGLPGAPTAGARPARRRPTAARLARHGRPARAAPPRRPRLRRERAARPGRRRAQHRGRRAARHRHGPAPARPRLRARPRHPLAHHGAADPGGARAWTRRTCPTTSPPPPTTSRARRWPTSSSTRTPRPWRCRWHARTGTSTSASATTGAAARSPARFGPRRAGRPGRGRGRAAFRGAGGRGTRVEAVLPCAR